MQDYAAHGKRCAFISLEEHMASKLFKSKRDQYISKENYPYITITSEINNAQDFKNLIDQHDIIFVDSFGKLREEIKEYKLKLDNHIRKAFDGKLFFLIFQRTSAKTMRGGADNEYDGDVILEVEKPTDDYRDNLLQARKNRYSADPDIKYSIYHQCIFGTEEEKKTNTSNRNNSSTNLVVSSY